MDDPTPLPQFNDQATELFAQLEQINYLSVNHDGPLFDFRIKQLERLLSIKNKDPSRKLSKSARRVRDRIEKHIIASAVGLGELLHGYIIKYNDYAYVHRNVQIENNIRRCIQRIELFPLDIKKVIHKKFVKLHVRHFCITSTEQLKIMTAIGEHVPENPHLFPFNFRWTGDLLLYRHFSGGRVRYWKFVMSGPGSNKRIVQTTQYHHPDQVTNFNRKWKNLNNSSNQIVTISVETIHTLGVSSKVDDTVYKFSTKELSFTECLAEIREDSNKRKARKRKLDRIRNSKSTPKKSDEPQQKKRKH